MTSVLADLKRKELFPVKILMFLIYGGQATLYPYFTVHLKSLGITIEQTAIIFAIQPIIALIIAPMVGILADKIGNFKFLFCFFLVFSAVTSNCLLTVPEVDYTMDYGNLHLNFSCMQPNQIKISESTCKLYSEGNISQIVMTVDNCIENSVDICFSNNIHSCVDINTPDIIISGTLNGDTILAEKIEYLNKTFKYLECRNVQSNNFTCMMKSNGTSEICKGNKIRSDEVSLTFWIYLGIRLMVTLGIGLVNGLFDAASMTIILKYDADIGYQRLWATVAMCLFAPLSGFLVDYMTEGDTSDFSLSFYLYTGLYLIAAFTAIFMDLSMKMPSKNACKNLKKLLMNGEVCLMLLHVAFLGICWGFLENFLFWFLEKELHSTNLLMGLTVTVGSGTGLPMSLVSTYITRKIGYVNVMVVAFAAYVVRYIGYSYATDPYICLVYEMMENFTVTLLTIGVTLYCTHLAPLEMLTTMMTLWNGLHVISGRAFGSLIGGFLMSRIGARPTFRIFAYVCAFFCVSYFLINVIYLKKLHKKKEETEEDSVLEEIREEIFKARALSVSSVIANYSIDFTYIPPINIASIKAIECRRHSHTPVHVSDSFKDMAPRKRCSQSLSFVPSATPATLPDEVRRHINRRFSVMSYTSQLETVPEESKQNSVEDLTLMDRGEPEGSENPPIARCDERNAEYKIELDRENDKIQTTRF